MLVHCLVVVYAFLALGLLAMLALNLSVLNPVAQTMKGFSVTDIYYHVLQDYETPDTSRIVTIVDMTDIQDRYQLAEMLDQIEAFNPKVVGVDIVFEGYKDEMGDMRITRSARQWDNTVFSYRLRDWKDTSTGYATEIHSFFIDPDDSVKISEGFTNYERVLYGGLKRKANLNRKVCGEPRNALVAEVIMRYTDGQFEGNITDDVNINFSPKVFRVVPYDSIAYHRDWIEDHIVLYGATHELADMHYTPIGEIAGIELLAYTIQTMLEQTEVRTPSTTATIILSFLIVLVTRIGRQAYLKWARSFKSEFVVFFLTTTFVIGILLFFWTAILVGAAFIMFTKTSISLNLGWALAAIPFLYGANEFAILTTNYFERKRKPAEKEEKLEQQPLTEINQETMSATEGADAGETPSTL